MDYGEIINKIELIDSVVYFLHNNIGQSIILRQYKDYNLVEYLKDSKLLI